MPRKPKQPTVKQKLFAQHPAVLTDPARAALESGYSATTATVASRMRAQMFDEISAAVRDRLAAVGVSDEEILSNMRDIMRADLTAFYKGDVVAGRRYITMKDFDDLTPEQRKLIKEIEFETMIVPVHEDEVNEKTGEVKGTLKEVAIQVVKKLKLYDRQKAVETLARIARLDVQAKASETPAPPDFDEELQGLSPEELAKIAEVFRESKKRRAKEAAAARKEFIARAGAIEVRT